MVVIHEATGVSHEAAGVLRAGTVVMQFAVEETYVGSVVSHSATLCTRTPAVVSAAGSVVLRGKNAPDHGSAIVRYVSYVVGDGAVAVCVEETGVTRFRPVVPRVVFVFVICALFVSRGAHKRDAIGWFPTRDRLVAWPSPSSVPSAPAESP